MPHHVIAAANSLDKLPAKKRDAVYARFVPESGLATFEALHWMLDSKRAAYVRAEDVACSIICPSGNEDKINPPSTVRRIVERHRRAVHEVLLGRSHWLLEEDGWQTVVKRVLQWLSETMVTDAAAPIANRRQSGARENLS